MHETRTNESGVLCHAMTRFVTYFTVTESHSRSRPPGLGGHPVRTPVAEILHLAQRTNEPREILEVAAEAEHRGDRVRDDEREAHRSRTAPRAGAPQRRAERSARRDADEGQAGERRDRPRGRPRRGAAADERTAARPPRSSDAKGLVGSDGCQT